MADRIIGVLQKTQQVYLKKLGFYDGEIDGIWNEKCCAAMEKWKNSGKFYPANKRRGSGPFIPFERLPKGYSWQLLDGQRCVVQDSTLPANFVMQELVNLIMSQTTKSTNLTNTQNTQTTKIEKDNNKIVAENENLYGKFAMQKEVLNQNEKQNNGNNRR